MTYTLIVDDERTPPQIYAMMKFNNVYLNKDIFVVRNVKHFSEILNSKGIPHTVSLDHDMSLDSYSIEIENVKLKLKDDGFSCAKILCYYHSQNIDLEFPQVYVHSQNPIGKENILSYINSYKKSLEY